MYSSAKLHAISDKAHVTRAVRIACLPCLPFRTARRTATHNDEVLSLFNSHCRVRGSTSQGRSHWSRRRACRSTRRASETYVLGTPRHVDNAEQASRVLDVKDRVDGVVVERAVHGPAHLAHMASDDLRDGAECILENAKTRRRCPHVVAGTHP